MSGKTPGLKKLHKRPSFSDSTNSESYELDLPTLPAAESKSSSRHQTPPQWLPLKVQSPVYSDVNKTGLVDEFSPTELSTIVEPSNENASVSSDEDMEDVRELRKDGGATATKMKSKNQAYTSLHQSTINSSGIYEFPIHKGSTAGLLDSDLNYIRASAMHESNYSKMKDEAVGKTRKESWVRRTLNRTFRYRYRMETVNMKQCCASRSGAKKFFTLSGVILLIMLTALVGIVVASNSWVFTRSRTDTIENDLNSYTSSLRACRIGRNWTSITITDNSSRLNYMISEQTLNGSLQELMLNNSVLTKANQLLLYLVIRSSNVHSIVNDTLDDLMPPAFINVALWTRTETPPVRQFRQYMAILNDPAMPQIVSRTFWFPLRETDNLFYVKAELMDSDLDEEMVPLTLSVFLVGHC